ncbi:feruloyl-CoA synthase [Variovorax soli]|uniref:feruloyl-CoA synthase n=1 Tax=Variovorax soli TaxID=376815 RepID=UPI000838D777
MLTIAISRAPALQSYRPTRMPQPHTLVERRPDGAMLLRSAHSVRQMEQISFAEFVPLWAQQRPEAPAFQERDGTQGWRGLNWRQLWDQVQRVAAGLLELGLGQDRPLMLLSGNSVEQAVVLLAAELVGVPTAPVSPAYSLLSQDFSRLKGVRDLTQPGALFVQSAAELARALAALDLPQAPVISVRDAADGQMAWSALVNTELTPERSQRVAEARAAIRPGHLSRILFTSGSTGLPKGVPLSYRNCQAVAAYMQHQLGELVDPQPLFLDWLPWHHGLGGVLNFGRSLVLGAAHYIDDGRPLPGLFERTLRNLRELSPSIFTSVPVAWNMLAPELERDPELAQHFFARVSNFAYGGASLPRDTWERMHRVAEKTIGQRVVFCSGLGATETTGLGAFCAWPSDDVGNIGVPMPGSEVKLVPLPGGDGRFEIRIRGEHVFSGYLGRPDLTAAAFDEEGFYRMGDAVRLVDPKDATRGLQFAGRVAEDFKLVNGTWVQTGAVRLALLERCEGLLSDAVVCGHDRAFIAALAWPNVAACKRLLPELEGLDAAALVQHPLLLDRLREHLAAQGAGTASQRVERLLLMAEPPSMDANEIADKGYVNQTAVRTRRAALVEALYEDTPEPHVVCATR